MQTPLERVKAELAMDRSGGEHQGTCLVSDNDLAKLIAVAEAAPSLVTAPLRYNDKRIEIDCASHADAMERVRKVRTALSALTKPDGEGE